MFATCCHSFQKTDSGYIFPFFFLTTEIVNVIYPKRSALLFATDSPQCCYWQMLCSWQSYRVMLFSVKHSFVLFLLCVCVCVCSLFSSIPEMLYSKYVDSLGKCGLEIEGL